MDNDGFVLMNRPDPEFYRCGAVRTGYWPAIRYFDKYHELSEAEQRRRFKAMIEEAHATGVLTVPPPDPLPRPQVWIGGSGKRWPDVIRGMTPLIVHERVADALTASRLRGYWLTEVEMSGLAATVSLMHSLAGSYRRKPLPLAAAAILRVGGTRPHGKFPACVRADARSLHFCVRSE